LSLELSDDSGEVTLGIHACQSERRRENVQPDQGTGKVFMGIMYADVRYVNVEMIVKRAGGWGASRGYGVEIIVSVSGHESRSIGHSHTTQMVEVVPERSKVIDRGNINCQIPGLGLPCA
jgi:hypothetical protein